MLSIRLLEAYLTMCACAWSGVAQPHCIRYGPFSRTGRALHLPKASREDCQSKARSSQVKRARPPSLASWCPDKILLLTFTRTSTHQCRCPRQRPLKMLKNCVSRPMTKTLSIHHSRYTATLRRRTSSLRSGKTVVQESSAPVDADAATLVDEPPAKKRSKREDAGDIVKLGATGLVLCMCCTVM